MSKPRCEVQTDETGLNASADTRSELHADAGSLTGEITPAKGFKRAARSDGIRLRLNFPQHHSKCGNKKGQPCSSPLIFFPLPCKVSVPLLTGWQPPPTLERVPPLHSIAFSGAITVDAPLFLVHCRNRDNATATHSGGLYAPYRHKGDVRKSLQGRLRCWRIQR